MCCEVLVGPFSAKGLRFDVCEAVSNEGSLAIGHSSSGDLAFSVSIILTEKFKICIVMSYICIPTMFQFESAPQFH